MPLFLKRNTSAKITKSVAFLYLHNFVGYRGGWIILLALAYLCRSTCISCHTSKMLTFSWPHAIIFFQKSGCFICEIEPKCLKKGFLWLWKILFFHICKVLYANVTQDSPCCFKCTEVAQQLQFFGLLMWEGIPWSYAYALFKA